ncbi:serine hydrolase domain-containing protein [Mongoliibacter ruber]|uniref:CubicO group peptidase (Beta-lactamase class C family) n=1 Tax=Mongoliibacter ruber TaxID=1750599 RepID=A0A2T0WK35_9BACT|nr:serine hydrolase domain-containing protein [Mongoliibacter ruber]PRY87068.1 CubicO group peptidase (beta-lactamase class C family) [Mongoliibacter ruber]
MNIKSFLVFFLTISFSLVLDAQVTQNQTIDNFLEKEYAGNNPGAVILIAQNNQIIFKNAYGLSDVKKRKTIKTDMIFQVGSMTKQFTSTAVLQLVEQGKVSLDDPIQKYVKYFPNKEYPVTIHHLLSQTSGIPEFFDIDEDEMYLLSQEHTPEQLISYFKDLPLAFEPGSEFQYSNSNYPLLGVVIEEVSGMSLKEYLKVNLFEPLKMHSTSLWYADKTKKKRIANGYRSYQGELISSPKIVGSVPYAAGAIVSTAEDLLLWNRELKNRTFLSDFIVESLITEKQTYSGTGTGYGYGFFIKELVGYKTIQHGGNLYGFTSSGLYLPDEDLFVCILSNKSLERTEKVANYLASEVLGTPLEIEDKSQLVYGEFEEYFGTYQLKGDSKLIEIFMLDDVLLLDFPEARGTGTILTVIDKDKMESKAVNALIQFTRDKKGQIIGFTADQNGITEWEKIK